MTTATFQTINCTELNELCNSGTKIDLIDVRTPVEFREVHSSFAANVPLDSLNPKQLMESRENQNQPLYVMCRSGNRSTKACDALVGAGYTNIINVEGGVQAWEAANLPVVRGKKAISLERQVRIAAGSLVVIGVILSQINPYFIGISAFVGAGLVFAGVTDTCGMGMLLAKMPWNQVKTQDKENSATGCTTDTSTSASCCG